MDPQTQHGPPDRTGIAAAFEALAELLGGHGTLAEARGISRQALDSMYGAARELYVAGRLAEAQRGFELLCLYDHLTARHWHALGACRQASGDYDGAAAALAFAAAETAEPDPETQLKLAECLVAAGAPDAAEGALAELASAGADLATETSLRARVRTLQEQLARILRQGPR